MESFMVGEAVSSDVQTIAGNQFVALNASPSVDVNSPLSGATLMKDMTIKFMGWKMVCLT